VAVTEEEGLLDAARAGDGAALERLLEQHEPRVYRFARRLCRQHEDAEDVLQESLLTAARSLADFRGDSSLDTWLFTIARSHCIKKRRRSRFAPAEVSLDAGDGETAREQPDPAPGPEETLRARRIETALEGAIARLDRPYREVFVLRDVEGLTAPEVAKVTGLSVPAIKSRLHRARSRVRDELSPLLLPGGPPEGVSDRPCPDVVRLFSQYLEGDISPKTCARMEKHLDRCPRCRASCDALREVLQTCRTAPSPEVPPALQEKVRIAIRQALGPGG
jgi:RNA polymerase sigma-70 factor (ECF subfamily)